MKSFVKRCALATLFTFALTTTVRAAEFDSSSILNTNPGESQPTQIAKDTEYFEQTMT